MSVVKVVKKPASKVSKLKKVVAPQAKKGAKNEAGKPATKVVKKAAKKVAKKASKKVAKKASKKAFKWVGVKKVASKAVACEVISYPDLEVLVSATRPPPPLKGSKK